MFTYNRQGALGWITIVNPPHNALAHPVFADVRELTGFLAEPALKGVILRGNGKHFCSGADPDSFRELFGNAEELRDAINQGKELIDTLSFAPVPVAALIVGSCLGGGMELALSCHFRFSSRNAMFGFPECDHGLMPGLGGTIFSQDVLTTPHLIDLVLSGRMIRADEALQIGLVDKTYAPADIEDAVVTFIDRLTARHPPKIIHSIMQSVHNGRRLPAREALREETRLFCELAKEIAPTLSPAGSGSDD